MKKFLLLVAVIAVIIFSVTTIPHLFAKKNYISALESILSGYGIEDAKISLESAEKYDGYRVYDVRINSPSISSLGESKIQKLVQELDNVRFGNDTLALTYVYSKGTLYDIESTDKNNSTQSDSSLYSKMPISPIPDKPNGGSSSNNKSESSSYSSNDSAHKCIADGCNKTGTKSIIGISGELEYYCNEHYKEMMSIVGYLLTEAYGEYTPN